MTFSDEATSRPVPGHGERMATRVAFFVVGVGYSMWAALVPYAKVRLGLDEATLGLLLLCIGLGSLLAMPFTGPLTGRFGCRRLLFVSLPATLVALPLLAMLESPWAMAACLLVFGAAVGMADVALNIQAVFVERGSGRALMSGFHGFYSVGGFCGAGGMALLLGAGLGPLASAGVLCAGLFLLLCLYGGYFLPYGADGGTRMIAMPRGVVLLIGVLCFIMYLSEGTILDWGALFMSAERGTETASAGLAFACFSIAMTLGRLFGDRVVQAFGDARVLLWGSLCGACGFGLTIFAPSAWLSFLGFGVVGLGVSNIVPVLLSATARQTIMPLGLAVSAVTTIGYLGILAGPALMGFVAHATSLAAIFIITLALMLFVAAVSRFVP
ncbi:MAG TPA: MFS transporter [Candidatus Bilophila faecipullorum]|uniref:MFS transporter n=2 Tax=Bilophila TaxID=35832 RepID=A0A9D1R3F5_9BACT|nr:MFS transporter [uncultured Bilophila sp.]HIW79406.1 MFS transporter [Candidatus Bilophila faecipullorum]